MKSLTNRLTDRRLPRCQTGFTLVEVIVSMVFSLALLASIYGVFSAQTHTVKGQESRMEGNEYAMSVLDTIVREIRNTGYFPTNTACINIANSGGIVSADAQNFRLVYDANADGVCEEDVAFTYDSTNKNILRNGAMITDGNATAVLFTYYPQKTSGSAPAPYCFSLGSPSGCSGMLAANLASVQTVMVSITIQTKSPDTRYGGQSLITMSSSAALRNHGL